MRSPSCFRTGYVRFQSVLFLDIPARRPSRLCFITWNEKQGCRHTAAVSLKFRSGVISTIDQSRRAVYECTTTASSYTCKKDAWSGSTRSTPKRSCDPFQGFPNCTRMHMLFTCWGSPNLTQVQMTVPCHPERYWNSFLVQHKFVASWAVGSQTYNSVLYSLQSDIVGNV